MHFFVTKKCMDAVRHDRVAGAPQNLKKSKQRIEIDVSYAAERLLRLLQQKVMLD